MPRNLVNPMYEPVPKMRPVEMFANPVDDTLSRNMPSSLNDDSILGYSRQPAQRYLFYEDPDPGRTIHHLQNKKTY